MRKLIIILFLMIIYMPGCGSSRSSNSSSDIVDSSSSQVSSASDVSNGAMLVNTLDEIGVCDSTKFRQLIYVIEEEKFYYCSKIAWTEINLKGEKGEKGDQGQQGTAGVSGKDGSIGTQGQQGTTGKDGRDGSSQVWVHPIDGTRWFLSRSFRINSLSITTSDKKFVLCPSGSHVPNDAEFEDAIVAGLWNQISSSYSALFDANMIVVLDQYFDPSIDAVNAIVKIGFKDGTTNTYAKITSREDRKSVV